MQASTIPRATKARTVPGLGLRPEARTLQSAA